MTLTNPLKGSLVALITPMHPDGSIDKKALFDLVEWHIASKTHGIIVAGTTGESAALEPEEHNDLIVSVVKQVAGRIPVIAGTGTNSTAATLKLTTNAKKAGADACLIVTPYYVRPTQNGLYEHYRTIAETIDIPIFLYNVPGRTGCDLLAETVLKLAQLKNIIGIKEASGDLARAQEIQRLCGQSLPIYSGNDNNGLELMQKSGALGVMSVSANVIPTKMAQMCEAALKGDMTTAEKLNNEMALLHTRLFLESNPIPTKWVLQKMGKIQSGIRLPLLPLDSKYHEEVKEAMKTAGVQSSEVFA